MIALLIALGVAATPPAVDGAALGRRIVASARAAEALQGPLDGAWRIMDGRGRPLLALEIVDPAGGGALVGAWREPGAAGDAGVIATIERMGERLRVTLSLADGAPATLSLKAGQGRHWRGWLTLRGRREAVIMRPVRS